MNHSETAKAVATVSESFQNMYEPSSGAMSWLEPDGATSPVQTVQSLHFRPQHSVRPVSLGGNYVLVVQAEELPFPVKLCAVGQFTPQVEPFRQLLFHGQPAKIDSSNLTIESRFHIDPTPVDFADTLSGEYAASIFSVADPEEFYQSHETADSDTDMGSDLGWISTSSTHHVLSLGDPVKLVDLPRKPPRVSLSDFPGDDD